MLVNKETQGSGKIRSKSKKKDVVNEGEIDVQIIERSGENNNKGRQSSANKQKKKEEEEEGEEEEEEEEGEEEKKRNKKKRKNDISYGRSPMAMYIVNQAQQGKVRRGEVHGQQQQHLSSGSDIDLNSVLRRWDVKLLDIQVESLQKESIDIFLVFKIGSLSGDYDNASGSVRDSAIVEQSKSMKQFKTEIIKAIEKESRKKVKKYFEEEIHASYNMLRQRNLRIEVWSYSRWSLNHLLGYTEVRLE